MKSSRDSWEPLTNFSQDNETKTQHIGKIFEKDIKLYISPTDIYVNSQYPPSKWPILTRFFINLSGACGNVLISEHAWK